MSKNVVKMAMIKISFYFIRFHFILGCIKVRYHIIAQCFVPVLAYACILDLAWPDGTLFMCVWSFRSSHSQMFLKINALKNSQNLQENTCATLCFNKETLAHVFSCEFCEIFKKIFFYRTSLVAASVHFWCRKFFWLFLRAYEE